MNRLFDHEKLEVYQESLAFVAWLEPLLRKLPKSVAVRDQLDRASTSIVLNLAEGNGKFTSADRCRFFDISRGSALECAAGLDVLVPQGGTGVSWVWSPPGKSGYAELFRCSWGWSKPILIGGCTSEIRIRIKIRKGH